MAEKRWTVDAVLALHPCEDNYPRERLEKLARGRTWSLPEILGRRDIPSVDRVWFACQPDVLTKPQRDVWMTLMVTRAVRRYALHYGVDSVETWARRWLSGDDRSESAAAEAAWAAWATGAAEAAARAAAEAAARAAAEAAAWAAEAARAAAWWAAGAAARAARAAWAAEAARAAEYRKQLRDLRCVLKASETAREAQR